MPLAHLLSGVTGRTMSFFLLFPTCFIEGQVLAALFSPDVWDAGVHEQPAAVCTSCRLTHHEISVRS